MTTDRLISMLFQSMHRFVSLKRETKWFCKQEPHHDWDLRIIPIHLTVEWRYPLSILPTNPVQLIQWRNTA